MAGRLTVTVQIEDPAWRKLWPRATADVRRLIGLAIPLIENPRPIKGGGAGFDGTVSVVLSDNAHLQRLNAQFRGRDKPTNVLSFSDTDEPLGGMALARETVIFEAEAQGKPFVNHAKHMILHGFLHLAGYDHETARAARLMEGLEIAILSAMGIPNPYLIEAYRRA